MTQFKENLKLREAVFRKMGAEWKIVSKLEGDSCWAWALNDNQFGLDCHYEPNGITVDPKPELLPPIESAWEVTAQYLVPFMRGAVKG